MSLKAILFDFNGTIINDERLHKKLVYQMMVEENLRPVSGEYREVCLGRSDRIGLREILSRRGRVVSETYLKALIRKKSSAYQQKLATLETLPIYPGAIAFLQQLQEADILMGIVTGALRSDVNFVLQRTGMQEYFSIFVTGDEINTSKPDPYGYLLAIERINRQFSHLQVQPENCLAIEDSPAGIEAAKQAKIQAIGLAHSYPFHMIQRQANWTVDSFAEIELERLQQFFALGKETVLQ
ncbi:MAG: HAD family phosphatase [Cyanobacteria bacterium SBLK]|nr:HAD family phosphatase [Cyanobacteria bacterium SBLK]